MIEKNKGKLDHSRLKILNRMLDAGYLSEKEIAKAKLEDLLFLDGISTSDLKEIISLQKAISGNQVIRFLTRQDEPGKEDAVK